MTPGLENYAKLLIRTKKAPASPSRVGDWEKHSMAILTQFKKLLIEQGKKHARADLSLWALIASNVVLIIWALVANWSLDAIMWVYWSQSVGIGIFWFVKIVSLKNFSTKGFKINDRPVPPTSGTKIETGVVFILHYGFFHVLYACGLTAFFNAPWPRHTLFMAAVFLAYQFFSFFYNKKWESKQKPNLGPMFVFPYLRIIPMHLTFIAGGYVQSMFGAGSGSPVIMVIFMVLKTYADAAMHIKERKGFGDKPRENTAASLQF